MVTAPPYDVIAAAERTMLAERHSANSVRVELPEPDPKQGLDRYGHAAQLLAEWQEDGLLVRDASPAFYAYRMTTPEGHATNGLIGALGIDDESASGILPHEQTLPKPKSDRLDLLRATRANLSPIWGLSLRSGLTELFLPRGAPDLEATDDDKVRHDLWVLHDPEVVRSVATAVAEAPVVIADGHHRYETSRTYWHEPADPATGADAVMALVVELSAEQLEVGPIHRVLSGLPDGLDLVDAFSSWFDVTRAGDLDDRTAGALGASGALALLLPSGAWLLSPKDGTPEAAGSDLDSSMVALVLAELPDHDLRFANSWPEAVSALAARTRRQRCCSGPHRWTRSPNGPTTVGGCRRRPPTSGRSPAPAWSSGRSTRRADRAGRVGGPRPLTEPRRRRPLLCVIGHGGLLGPAGGTAMTGRPATGRSRTSLVGASLVGAFLVVVLAACSATPSARTTVHRPATAVTDPRNPPTSSTTTSVPSAVPTTTPAPLAPVPGWGAPLTTLPPGGGFTSLACISDTFCVAAGGGANNADALGTTGSGVTVSWDGAAWSDPSVYFPAPANGTTISPVLPAIGCTSGPFCLLVDGTGHASTGDGTNWSLPSPIPFGTPLAGNPSDPGAGRAGAHDAAVACAGPGFCATVDNTGQAASYQGGNWSAGRSLGAFGTALYQPGFVGISCPTPSMCRAVVGTAVLDWNGSGWSEEGAPWTTSPPTGSPAATAIGCPTAQLCAIVSGTSLTVGAPDQPWTAPQVIDPAGGLDSISCPSATFCMAADLHGNVLQWNGGTWSAAAQVIPGATDYTGDPTTVACSSPQFCMVLNGDGDYATYDRRALRQLIAGPGRSSRPAPPSRRGCTPFASSGSWPWCPARPRRSRCVRTEVA